MLRKRRASLVAFVLLGLSPLLLSAVSFGESSEGRFSLSVQGAALPKECPLLLETPVPGLEKTGGKMQICGRSPYLYVRYTFPRRETHLMFIDSVNRRYLSSHLLGKLRSESSPFSVPVHFTAIAKARKVSVTAKLTGDPALDSLTLFRRGQRLFSLSLRFISAPHGTLLLGGDPRQTYSALYHSDAGFFLGSYRFVGPADLTFTAVMTTRSRAPRQVTITAVQLQPAPPAVPSQKALPRSLPSPGKTPARG